MAGRPVNKKANIPAIHKLVESLGKVWYGESARPIIAYTMRNCGCTYTEIGEAFGVSRQMAQTLVTRGEEQL